MNLKASILANLGILTLLILLAPVLSFAQTAKPKEKPEVAATPEPAATPATSGPESPTLKETAQKVGDGAKAVASKVNGVLSQSRENRANRDVTLMLGYAPIDLILPSKTGAAVTWNEDDQSSYELEYMSATLSVPFIVDDLGSFKDRRVSLVKRAYNGRNSFHFIYGLSYFDTKIHLGNDYMDYVNGAPAALDLVGVKSLGLVWGVGNRWTFNKGFTAGVDWFSWAQPLIVLEKNQDVLNYISNEDARRTVRETLNLTTYLPRLVLMKVQLGWSF